MLETEAKRNQTKLKGSKRLIETNHQKTKSNEMKRQKMKSNETKCQKTKLNNVKRN